MSASLTSAGLTIQTFDEILEEIIGAIGLALNLNAAHVQAMRDGVQSSLGQLARVDAERESIDQEMLLKVYNTLSWYAEGEALDKVVALLGITRRPAFKSEIEATISGTNGTIIPDGAEALYVTGGTVWVVTGGPYTIASGTASITLESKQFAAHEITAPSSTWQFLSTIAGVTSFVADNQSIVGSPIETDAELRARGQVEAYRRGQGPLQAIEAAVIQVDGVTFVKAWDNPTDVDPDSDGIPSRAINVVVDGGTDAEVAEAILVSRPAGMYLHGTDVSVIYELGYGRRINVRFDRVADVPMWIKATLTTSTSEEPPTPDVDDAVAADLLALAPVLFGIGDDVLPSRLRSGPASYSGVDDVLIEISDDGVVYQTAKYPISIREKATFDAARITVIEV